MQRALPTFLGLVLVGVVSSIFLGCSGSGKSNPPIQIDGSSTLAPVSKAIAEEFQQQKKGKIKVVVGISGTGGGFKKFVRSELDISDASRPILKAEMEEAKKNGVEFIELPVCFDALTIVIHRDNSFAEKMTIAQLKKLWEPGAEGKINKWSDIDPSWPAERISLFGAGTDSGTWDYFTEAVVGKAKSCRADFTATEDDNVIVNGVSTDKFALGFLPFSYFDQNRDKLKSVKIKWDKNVLPNEYIEPSLENVLKGVYNPLSRPLFIYVNKKSLERTEVREFIEFYLSDATKICKEVKYLPLTETAYELARQRFEKGEVGSAFGGTPEVGVAVEEILKRQPKQ